MFIQKTNGFKTWNPENHPDLDVVTFESSVGKHFFFLPFFLLCFVNLQITLYCEARSQCVSPFWLHILPQGQISGFSICALRPITRDITFVSSSRWKKTEGIAEH